MAFERWRLAGAAALWAGAGACAHAAGPAARSWVPVALLALGGLALAWPLLRAARRQTRHTARPSTPAPASAAPPKPPTPPTPATPATASAPTGPPDDSVQRLHVHQALLDHLPVAAWALCAQQLRPLTSRAHRLAAPGGVRDKAALDAVLRNSLHSGPVQLTTERGTERWQLHRQALALDGREQVLLVLVPLERELESASLLAWHQLVQVLTHEIMNSLTPIQSLSQTALMLLDDGAAPGGPTTHANHATPANHTHATPANTDADLRTALQAIALRAEGLTRFVTTYRQVSLWPAPTLAPVDVQALFDRLQQAVAPAWAARGGSARFALATPGLLLQADAAQLEQALLALLRNAEQATDGQASPHLWVQARTGRGGRLHINVRDNGPGVPAGLERQIFLPFFSAREGGQGIGLTVVRQLVHGMGGRVRHVRPLEGGAGFVLSF